MVLPVIFANLNAATGANLDQDFAALGAISTIPCSMSGTTALTLTPISGTPTVSAYVNGQTYSAIANATNAGSVTAGISGLAFLNVYKDTASGPVALTGNEITQYCRSVFAYDSTLNSGAGGFHLAQIATVPVLPGYISGYTLSNDGTTPNSVLDIAAGSATDSTGTATLLGSALTKSTAGSWVAGTGANGMGVGLTITSSTWYHVFAIVVSGSIDYYFDTSTTAANKPVGATLFRYIGSFKTDGSAHILAFTQYGQRFKWASTVTDLTAGVATVSTNTVLSSPLGFVTHPTMILRLMSTAAADNALLTLAGSTASEMVMSLPTANQEVDCYFQTTTNTASQIAYTMNAARASLTIQTTGYINPHVAAVW